MKAKNIGSWTVLGLTFLVVFNVLFFIFTADDAATETGRPVGMWVSYAFIHVSYLIALFAPLFVTEKSQNKTDYVYSLSSMAISYWWVELIVGAIFIIITSPTLIENVNVNHSINMWAIAIQSILCGVFVIWFCIMLLANSDTEEKQLRHDAELQYVKIASGQLGGFMNAQRDRATQKAVEKLYDCIRTSPLKSVPALMPLEQEILGGVMELIMLEDNAQIQAASAALLKKAMQRNQQLIINNKYL